MQCRVMEAGRGEGEVGGVLCVGLMCVDVINYVDSFPLEDSDNRVSQQVWSLGGNACNNTTVLTQLGAPCSLFASIAKDNTYRMVMEKFKTANVDVQYCLTRPSSSLPLSMAIVNKDTGSRTILHSPNKLAEPTFEEFSKLPLNTFRWIHFEGRNVPEVRKMIDHVLLCRRESVKGDAASHPEVESSKVEIEKRRPDIDSLLPGPDVIFLSKEWSRTRGYEDMASAVEGVGRSHKGAVVVCGWGEKGACGRTPHGTIVFSPAFPPPTLVDTLGAGDTFVAATIHALSRGHTLQDAIRNGCVVAGRKCGQKGFFEITKE